MKDRRQDGCGYDFQCEAGGVEAKLEVKTFAPGGRVIVTLRELQEAHTSQASYYLVGLCDDGGPPSSWEAFIIQDPIERLLHLREFQLETKIEARRIALHGDVRRREVTVRATHQAQSRSYDRSRNRSIRALLQSASADST